MEKALSGWRVLGGLGAGALFAACFPPYNAAYLLPLAAAALLWLLHNVSPRHGAYIGFACGCVYFGGTLFWLANLFGAAAVSLCAILAGFVAVFAVLYVWLRSRLPRVPFWLVAPVTWTAIEFFRSELFVLRFGWMGLGYAVANFPTLAAGAGWFGAYGLTFAALLLGALLLFCARGGRKHALLVAGLGTVWLLLCVLPRPVPRANRPLFVRLVQAFSDDEESLFALSQADPSTRVDVLVWPEYSLTSDPTRNPRLWKKLQELARGNRCHFVFGAKNQFDPDDEASFRNTAFVLGPDGNLVGRHVKNHLVHFVRDGVAGTTARAIPTARGRFGVAICFDLDYPDVARRLAQDRAEVFFVPNMDPGEWGPVQQAQHRLLFQLRAGECGRWLARADVSGGTSLVAPTGHEVARVATADPAKLDVVVGRETGRTVYVRGGWRFAPICLGALAALCAWSLLPARLRPR